MAICNQCPRKCGADRKKEFGMCGVYEKLRVAGIGLHHWEEPIISGSNGSGTIFFSGCNLKCVYCQNYPVSRRGLGKDISVSELAAAFRELEEAGAHNINLVTPNHFADGIMQALDIYRPSIPIVYNTSGYDSLETLQKLEPYIDIFLADYKYGDCDTARTLSKARDYPETAAGAILAMRDMKPDIIKDGLMRQGLIVRHLVLPGYFDNSLKALDFIVNNLDKRTIVSLMNQYTPISGAPSELMRRVKPLEYKILVNKLLKAGFDNAYVQEFGSSSEEYIPEFFGEYLR